MFHETESVAAVHVTMAVLGKQAAPVVGQAILQQIQRVNIEASQKAQS